MSAESTDDHTLNPEQNPPSPPIDDDGTVKEGLLSKAVCNLETECWDWTAGKTGHGYGNFRYNGRNRHAHQVYFRTVHGGVPGGHIVRHTCDNRSCGIRII